MSPKAVEALCPKLLLLLIIFTDCSKKAFGCAEHLPAHYDVHSFIRVRHGVFVDESCREFIFSGYNSWQIIEAALGLCCGGAEALTLQFHEAARQNLSVVRMFGFPVQEGFNLQTAPGVYNETAFRGLDAVIAEAGKFKLRLIIVFANNFAYNSKQTDWKCAYTNWSTTAKDCGDFFSDGQAMSMYKKHIAKVVFRVNTFTGIPYRLDPTIMAWNLMNEPRVEHGWPRSAVELQAWIAEMASYVKRMARYHMLTVGDEGFYQPSNCQSKKLNPVPGRPIHTGQDFLPNHVLSSLDYASIHFWPDNWNNVNLGWGKRWLQVHASSARALGKPLVIEEWGKFEGGWFNRNHSATAEAQLHWYRMTYREVEHMIGRGGGTKGILFWRWAAEDPTIVMGTADEATTLQTNGTVFQHIIRPFSARLAAFNADQHRPVMPQCEPLHALFPASAPAHMQSAGSTDHSWDESAHHKHPKTDLRAGLLMLDSAPEAAKAAVTHASRSTPAPALPTVLESAHSPMPAAHTTSSRAHAGKSAS